MQDDPIVEFGMHLNASSKIFTNARLLREHMTCGEIKLWEYLRQKPFNTKFRRQHPISKYVLDFYAHKLRLSIEIDGKYHQESEQMERDESRTDFLKSIGITEIRFSEQEVVTHLKDVIEIIESHIKSLHK